MDGINLLIMYYNGFGIGSLIVFSINRVRFYYIFYNYGDVVNVFFNIWLIFVVG